MDASKMRSDITDRGIEKAENGMKPVLQPLSDQLREQAGITDSSASKLERTDSPLMAGNRSENATPQPDDPKKRKERDVPPLDEEAVRNRKVNPEAVRESFKEAELDPIAETEPEEGESAA